MAYKLTINDPKNNLKFNVRYQNLAKKEKPAVVAKAPNGNVVKERTTYQGNVLGPGSTQRQWCDDQGTVYSKQELTFWYNDEQVSEISQTKLFEIEGFQPLSNYTDQYVIDRYYEIFPDTDGHKKDFDKAVAKDRNLKLMRKLWEHLDREQVVARGEFCPASRGFVASDGYIRAIKINGAKWGLEIGLFKEEKVFQHLQEKVPEGEVPEVTKKAKKLKMV